MDLTQYCRITIIRIQFEQLDSKVKYVQPNPPSAIPYLNVYVWSIRQEILLMYYLIANYSICPHSIFADIT